MSEDNIPAGKLFELGEIRIGDDVRGSGIGEEQIRHYLDRHQAGDWTSANPYYEQGSQNALKNGGVIVTTWQAFDDDLVLLVTAADRSNTLVLMEHEFWELAHKV